MDNDIRELIARLATQLGMILEDAAPVALTLQGQSSAEQYLAMAHLQETIAKADAILSALNALAH